MFNYLNDLLLLFNAVIKVQVQNKLAKNGNNKENQTVVSNNQAFVQTRHSSSTMLLQNLSLYRK